MKALIDHIVSEAAEALGDRMVKDIFSDEIKKSRKPANRRKAIKQETEWLKSKKRCKKCGHREIFHAHDSEYGYDCIVDDCWGDCKK